MTNHWPRPQPPALEVVTLDPWAMDRPTNQAQANHALTYLHSLGGLSPRGSAGTTVRRAPLQPQRAPLPQPRPRLGVRLIARQSARYPASLPLSVSTVPVLRALSRLRRCFRANWSLAQPLPHILSAVCRHLLDPKVRAVAGKSGHGFPFRRRRCGFEVLLGWLAFLRMGMYTQHPTCL